MVEKAQNLVAALESLSPIPLEFSAGRDSSFYVERDDNPLEQVRTLLIKTGSPTKLLLAGHRGSGKSTELNRLAVDSEITEKHEVVKFSAKEVLDLNDVSYIDLLIVSVSQINEQLRQRGVHFELAGDLVDRLERWPQRVEETLRSKSKSGGVEVSAGTEPRVPGFLGGLFARFAGRLSVEYQTRSELRETVEPRLSEFLKDLRAFFLNLDRELLQQHKKRLLLVIEDLDKIPALPKAKELFHRNGLYLTQPPCSIIFTVPIALHYDSDFQGVASTFGHSVFLPNVRLQHADRSRGESRTGWEIMQKFVTQRVDVNLVEASALREAVRYSGGIFQQLQRLMEHACLRALSEKRDAVTKEDVLASIADLRAEFERVLRSTDYELLEEVRNTRQVASEPEALELLHSTHLIEYRNDERWCDINPLLERTLERWQTSKAALPAAPTR